MFVSLQTAQKERVHVRKFFSVRCECFHLRVACILWNLSEVEHLLETFVAYFSATQAAQEGR